MKTIFVLLVITATVSGIDWTGFHVTWNTSARDPGRNKSFFTMPRDYAYFIDDDYVNTDYQGNEDVDWIQVTNINSLNVTVVCYADVSRVCTLYDNNGFICGFQVIVVNGYNLSNFDVWHKITLFDDNGQPVLYYASTVHTVDPEIIKAGGRSQMNNLTGEQGIWIETTNGFNAIPRKAADLDSARVQGETVSEMGTQYHYNMSTGLDCKTMSPWYLLYEEGELIGCAVQAFGSCVEAQQNWCETFSSSDIKSLIPEAPQCLADWTDEYGLISMHFWSIAEPWKLSN